jgi:lipid A 3-O-deacylase
MAVVTSAMADGTNRQDFVFTANEENDYFSIPETDKHYTQGIHFSLLWPDSEVPLLARPLAWTPPLGFQQPIQKFGFELGQDLYTPIDLSASAVIPNDRPYAGWLYLGALREDRGVTANQIPTLDRYEVELGVVGPWSLGADEQNWWHDLIGNSLANGWSHQLENEPGLLLRLDRKWRVVDAGNDDGLHLQLLPRAGVALGNIQTSARIGATVRVGHHIPDEFAATIPPRRGWYVFSDVGGRGVLYNEFLNGDLFHASHSVTPEPGVLELRAGLVFELGRSEISYTYVYLNKEFKQQGVYDAYGSLTYVYRF